MRHKVALIIGIGSSRTSDSLAASILAKIKQLNHDNEFIVTTGVSREDDKLQMIDELLAEYKLYCEIHNIQQPISCGFSYEEDEEYDIKATRLKLSEPRVIDNPVIKDFYMPSQCEINMPWYDRHTLNKSKKCKNGNQFKHQKAKKSFRGR